MQKRENETGHDRTPDPTMTCRVKTCGNRTKQRPTRPHYLAGRRNDSEGFRGAPDCLERRAKRTSYVSEE